MPGAWLLFRRSYLFIVRFAPTNGLKGDILGQKLTCAVIGRRERVHACDVVSSRVICIWSACSTAGLYTDPWSACCGRFGSKASMKNPDLGV